MLESLNKNHILVGGVIFLIIASIGCAIVLTNRPQVKDQLLYGRELSREELNQLRNGSLVITNIYMQEYPEGIKTDSIGTEKNYGKRKYGRNNNTLIYSDNIFKCDAFPLGHQYQDYKNCTLEVFVERIDGTRNVSFKLNGLVDNDFNSNFDFNFSKESLVDFKNQSFTFEITYSEDYVLRNREDINVSYRWQDIIINGTKYVNKTTYYTITNYPIKDYSNFQTLPKGNQRRSLFNDFFIGDLPYLDPTISACSELASPGVYTLTSNIEADTSPCISITSNNVELNGLTRNINDPSPNVILLVSASGLDNVTVRNINLTNGAAGLGFSSMTNSLLDNISITGHQTEGISGAGNNNVILRNISGSSMVAFSGDNIQYKNINISFNPDSIVNSYPAAMRTFGNNVSYDNLQLGTGSSNNNALEIGGYAGYVNIANISVSNVLIRQSGAADTSNFGILAGNVTNITFNNINIMRAESDTCVSFSGRYFYVNGLVCNNSDKFGTFIITQDSVYRNISILNTVEGNAIEIYRPNITIYNLTINNTGLGNGIRLVQSSDKISINGVNITNTNNSFFDLILNNPTGSGGNGEVEFQGYYIENYNFSASWKNKLSFWKMDKTRIDFAESVFADGNNLTRDIKVDTTNFAEVLEQNNVALNKTANVTFWNLPAGTKNNILRNHQNCTDCVNFTALDANPIKFSVNNWSNYSINITATPTDTCTYSGVGNWNVLCADNCTITTNYNLGGNNFTIGGTGRFILLSNITNYGRATLGDSIPGNMCQVGIYSGGGFRR